MKAISLFAGCGGDTLGLEQAGFEVVAFSEKMPTAIASHVANFPSSVHIRGARNSADICDIPDATFAAYRGQIDLVFAGFPCQGFSKAGKKKDDDPRNQLYLQFLRVTEQIRPPFLIGENVPGLLTKLGVDGHPFFDVIKARFAASGYEITAQVMVASKHGVPQARKRLIMLGWDRTRFPSLDPERLWSSLSAIETSPSPNLVAILESRLDGAIELAADQVPSNFDTVALICSAGTVVPAEPKPHPYLLLKVKGLLSVGKRSSPHHAEVIDPSKPAKTIICSYDHQPRLYVGLKQGEKRYVRCLTVTELKQIQGFPANYEIIGNWKDAVTQVGNAVPPPLIQAVATVVSEILTTA